MKLKQDQSNAGRASLIPLPGQSESGKEFKIWKVFREIRAAAVELEFTDREWRGKMEERNSECGFRNAELETGVGRQWRGREMFGLLDSWIVDRFPREFCTIQGFHHRNLGNQ